ncbi:conserved exported hypothetical protein [uncultured delta proteobacterium]|uniref:Lipid A deacylase LpxR family protein n=1 Tax=uncultured delta proteobacterium TaxID=34034 RepID=A0A212J070_9DELT|nr:conserved exported hypothetical protein [uncultured delta proteobacterium]
MFAMHSLSVMTSPVRIFFLVCIVGSLLASAGVSRAEKSGEKSDIPGPTVRIYFENDLFYNEDRDYTNAVQLRVISPDLRTLAENGFLPEGISNLLGEVPFPGYRGATQYNISAGFGQQIYTPKDTGSRSLQKDDRPYAGYLYGTLGLHAKRYNRLDTIELAAGIIGPSALAEQAQNEVHRIRSIDTAKGWDHQLRDEPALMLTWSRIWRLNAEAEPGGWGWDILPQVNVSAGTPFTRAGIGAEVRFGWNLPPDYGTSTIRPGSGITRPLEEGVPGSSSHYASDKFLDNFSLYVFLGADGHAVAWDSFLDGNIWKDNHSVDKFPLAGQVSGGVAVLLYDFQVTYTHVYSAKEFHGQEKGHNFGSITVGYRF